MKCVLLISIVLFVIYTCESATLCKRDAKDDALKDADLSVIKVADVVGKLRGKGLSQLAAQLESEGNDLKALISQLKAATKTEDVAKLTTQLKAATVSVDQDIDTYQGYLHC